jgi:Cu-Zn family superoxide dismutase
MNKIGKLFLCVMLAACGGSSSSHQTARPAPVARTTPMPRPHVAPTASASAPVTTTPSTTLPSSGSSTYASGGGMGAGSASGAGDMDKDADDMGAGAASGTTATDTAATADVAGSKIAKAEMTSIKDGSSIGTLTFELGSDGQVTINGDFTGLAKGDHAIYIHEKGDCSNKAKNVGGHLNPTHQKHGSVGSPKRHEGDFGNITADKDGAATFSMTTDSVSMEPDRPDSILNRAVVIHVKKDSKSGNAGAAFACGVITMQ